jgi:hypothetical protein
MALENVTVNGVPLVDGSTGKIQHRDRASAQAHADGILKKDGHLPNIYICAECGYLHVGGGRKSDQPIVRAKQTKTPWRERMVRPSPGKTLTVEELIVEDLINTFSSDKRIAAKLHINWLVVYNLRRSLNVPAFSQRRQEVIASYLKVNPRMGRKLLAKKLNVPLSCVEGVVKKLGITGQGYLSPDKKGVKSPHFGKRWKEAMPEKDRKKIKQAQDASWVNPTEKRKKSCQLFTPEERAKGQATYRRRRKDPVYAAKVTEKAKKSWTPERRAKLRKRHEDAFLKTVAWG